MTHEELQELLGAYAIDAVDPDEVALVDAHLAECPRCRAEVADLREVAALLGQSGADAPEGVWERIAASLTEVPPPLRLEVQRERRASRSRLRWFGGAAAAVAAAVAVVLGVSVVNLRNEVDDLKAGGTDVAAAAQQAMTTTGARVAHVVSPGAAFSGVAVVQPGGQGYLVATSFPPLEPGMIYQLWGASSLTGTPISLGTMPGPGVYAFTADPSVHVVMVSKEREPVAAPTSAPVATGTLA